MDFWGLFFVLFVKSFVELFVWSCLKLLVGFLVGYMVLDFLFVLFICISRGVRVLLGNVFF